MGRSYLRLRKDNGKVEREGVEQPPAEIVAERGDIIVLKVPGHGYWTGRGLPQGYAGAEFQVWQFEDDHTTTVGGWANLLIEFPVRTPKETR